MEGIVIQLAVQLWAGRFGVIDQNPGLMTRNLIATPGRTSPRSDTVTRHADVCAALGLSTDPATAAHQLALIRGGFALGVKVIRPSLPA
jgi:hypothetical protein